MAERPGFSLGATVALAVLVFDQLTKWWILERVMQPPQTIAVTPFLNLVLVWNRGVSFGLFNTDSPYNALILGILAAVVAVALVIWMWRCRSRLTAIALGLIIGGAIGNVVDRVRFGAVADFVDVHAYGFHWPAFNVADSGITVGAIVLIAESLLTRREKV